MLVARATGDLARLLFPDIVKGLGYVAEDEPEAIEAWAPAVDDYLAKPARKPLQRRTRATKATAAPVVAVAPPTPIRAIEDAPLPDDDGDEYARTVAEQAREAIEADLAEPPPSTPRTTVALEDTPLPLDDVTPVSTLPDPQPEQPDNEGAAPGPVLIGVRPLKALNAGLTRELGTAATRAERHMLVEAIVGHPVDTTKELTRADGYRVLDYFDRFTNGDAKWDFVDGGARIVVEDTLDEPPDNAE
jgi:hypothetical protein